MKDPFYFHSKPSEGSYRITVAGILDGVTLNVGASICSPSDQFIKAKGRATAAGRAQSTTARVASIDLSGENLEDKSHNTVAAALFGVVNQIQERIDTGQRPYQAI